MALISAKDYMGKKGGGAPSSNTGGGLVSASDFISQKKQKQEDLFNAQADEQYQVAHQGSEQDQQILDQQQLEQQEQSFGPTQTKNAVQRGLDYVFQDNPVARVLNYPFAKAAELSVPDAPYFENGQIVPGSSARQDFLSRNPIRSTGNETADKVGDFIAPAISFFTPMGGPGENLAASSFGAVEKLGASKLGQKATETLGKLGASAVNKINPVLNQQGINISTNLAEKAAQGVGKGVTAGALYGAQEPFALENGDLSKVPESMVKNAAMFGGIEAGLPFLGAGLKGIAGKAVDAYSSLANTAPNSGILGFGKGAGEKLRVPENPENISDLIDVGGKPQKEGFSWDKFLTAAVDENRPLQKATERLSGGKNVPIQENPFQQAWLSRGWKGKADTFLENGVTDAAGDKVAAGLKEVLAPIQNKLKDFREYVVALRSKEYARDGLESGVKPELADKAIEKYGTDDIKAAQQGLRKYIDDMNEATLVRSGVRSAEQQAKLSAEHPNYIPMFRTREQGIRDTPQSASNKRIANQKDPIKKRTGSKSAIIDPLESIIKQTYKNTAIAEKNNVMRTLVDLARKHPNNDFIQPVKAEKSALQKASDDLEAFLLDPSTEMEGKLKGSLDLFKPDKDGIFTVMIEGKPEQWKVSDPMLAETIAGLNNESVGLLATLLGKPTGALKAGLVLAPDFLVKNLVRDQFSAFINSRYGYIPLWDMANGLSSVLKKDDFFYKWMANGGANGAWVSLERDYLQGQIRRLTQTGVKAIQKNPLEWLRVLSEVSEQATRVGEFKKGLKKGANPQEAALASRDVTLDFSRTGAKTKGLNKAIAFFNVAVQSLDKLARQFKERPKQTFARAVAGITLPSVTLYMMNYKNPKYQELPQWEKDMYWHIFLPTVDEPMRIPKPFEFGVMFGTYPERQLQAMFTDDPKAFDGFAKQVVDGFTPSVLPTLFAPWIEAYSNKKLFTDAPIVPKREEGLNKEDQYGPYTSEVAKGLGKLTEQSPRIIENYITGYTGTLGKYGLQVADNVLTQTKRVNPTIKPEGGLASYPVARSFFSKGLEGSSKSVDEFYKERDKMTKAQASSKKNEESFEDAAKLKQYNKIADMIGKQQKQVRAVLDSKDLNPGEKRTQLQELNLSIINMARLAKGQEAITK